MARYIDADELHIKMEDLYEHHLEMNNFSADGAVADCLDLLDNTPTADVVEVKHGYYEYDALEGQSYCSICESPKPSNGGDIRGNEVRYCYYCGAKMRGDDE